MNDFGHLRRSAAEAALGYQVGPKSVITYPSGGQKLPERGWYEITGLAWSGGGAIRKGGDIHRRRQNVARRPAQGDTRIPWRTQDSALCGTGTETSTCFFRAPPTRSGRSNRPVEEVAKALGVKSLYAKFQSAHEQQHHYAVEGRQGWEVWTQWAPVGDASVTNGLA